MSRPCQTGHEPGGGGRIRPVRVGIRLLGGFSVSVDGVVVDPAAWPTRRALQLVALLALAPSRRLATEQVMDALWPELEPHAARANLHKAASHARKAMANGGAVVLKGGVVTLWPEAEVAVDAAAFEVGAVGALAAGDPSTCGELADTYTGDVLPEELYEEWTIATRDRLRRLYRDLLERAGRWADLVELDPADEGAHLAIMRSHQREGRLHAAIRQFHLLRAALARELAVPPGPESMALYRELVGSSPSGWIRPALVGREIELIRARTALRRALEGRPAAVLVSGPAGIGKTRLCEELLEQAEADGWSVLRACAAERTETTPFGPLVDAIEAALVERPALAVALDDRDRALLSRLATGSGGPADGPAHRHAVFRLLGRVVAQPQGGRAALFIDDIHLADDATIALAAIAASAAPPRGMLLVATHRDDPTDAVAGLTADLLASGIAVQVHLDALSRNETELIAASVVGRSPTDDEQALVWELSGGNPFFALEVASSLATDTDPAAGNAPLAAVVGRLERLRPLSRSALRAVALVTDEFAADELCALSGLTAGEANSALDAALAGGVIGSTGSGTYRFRHDLIRQALGADANADEQGAAHLRFAEHLVANNCPPGAVARHLVAGGRDSEARPFLTTAAAHAMQVGAPVDALTFLEEALRIAPRAPDLLALRADALFAVGDPSSPAGYAVAMAVADDLGRSSLAIRRARALILAGGIPDALETLAEITEVPAGERVSYLVAQGLAHWCSGDTDEAERVGREARALAEQQGDLHDFVDATMLMAMVAHDRGAWPQRASLDLFDSQLRPELAAVVIDAHLCVAESYLYGGVPYPDVVSFAGDLRERGTRMGVAHAEAFATTLLGEAQLLMGDTEAARDILQEAARLHRRVGILCGEALSLQRLGQALAADDAYAEAEATLAGALVAARGSPVATRHLLDRIHGTAITIAPGAAAAMTAVDEAIRAVRGPFESCPPCSINFTIPAAIACADGMQLDRARGFLAAAQQVVAVFYPKGGWHAALDEARGHLARSDGDEAAATRFLVQAAEAFGRLGQPRDAERCRASAAATAARS